MNTAGESKTQISLALDADEARHLLQGLREHRDALGAAAQELERQLTAIGITPPEPPDHIRTEYAPPL